MEDFKIYLKHKRKEIKLEDLIVRLRIEEDNRVSEKKVGNHSMESKAHVIEERHKTNKKRKYVGQQVNHKRKAAQANITEVEKLSENASNISFFTVLSEVNLMGNTKELWVDTGATRHICSDKKMFSSYEAINDGEQLYNTPNYTLAVL